MNSVTPQSGNGSSNGADTASKVHQAIDHASEGAHPMIDQLASTAHRAVGSASRVSHTAADRLIEKGEHLNALVEQGSDYIRQHPILSVSLAAAGAYLLSRLFSSRHGD